ncbi:MAG: hypothetical protein LBD11_07670 [Candidatus Peribacteria bacterium]|jgi:broad specificity phosphatase PhoE|nr:hypothetical protein [Candidatus Peribacteria bacterium]
MKPNLTDTDITNTDKGAILRHAPAKYINQKITPPQTKFSNKKHQIADFKQLSEKFLDLREDKIQELKQNIETYLEENRETLKDKKIRIWISPFGRTMETGKILLEALEKRGIFIDSISLVEQLEEVRNFHRPMLNAFAN